MSRPGALLAGGTWEEARFIKGQETDHWVALVTNTDKLRLTVWLTQPMDRPTMRGAMKVVEIDLKKDAFAVTRSGRHLLTVTDDGLTIRNLVDGSTVDRRADGPLVTLRNEILGRFGDSGPGTWWLTDDLRCVAFVPPWTLEDGTPVESMPVTLFGVALDLRNDGLVYDRERGAFRRCHRLVELGALRDVESVQDDVLLLYGAGRSVLNVVRIALVDLELRIRRQEELSVPFVFGQQNFQWLPWAGKVHLVGKAISPNGETIRIYTWVYERGETTTLEVPWDRIKEALEAKDR